MNTPNLVFADKDGNIMDFPQLAMVGRSGDYLAPVESGETIPLPEGSELYVLPDRAPIGQDRETGEIITLECNPYDGHSPVYAVATFLAAAYTQTMLPAWDTRPEAATLPLYAYTALGWQDDGFVTTAMRVDASSRQDPETFVMDRVHAGVEVWKDEFPENRLVKHLENCALCYGCPAALNMFQGREEGPLPTSPSCNARCLGCISFQPGCEPPSPQDRITFVPTPEEIAEVALKHLYAVDNAVVSFGQGCEGEPLLVSDVIEEAIRLIRRQTDRGTINLNSNASKPEKVARLADAGLDSLRISMNSACEKTYLAYYRPHYDFSVLGQSARAMKERGRFVSLNLFVFPGLTDTPPEIRALRKFVEEHDIDLIQWRNLNIDPDWYMDTLGRDLPVGTGVRELIESMPVRRGYFNPPLDKDRRPLD